MTDLHILAKITAIKVAVKFTAFLNPVSLKYTVVKCVPAKAEAM